ncbi:hypothetical protein Tco_1061100, partial [Tanacetum coccineum]
MTSGKASNVPSARTKKSLTQLHGDDFSVVKSTNVIREMPHIQELSDNGGGSSSDSSSVNFRNRSVVRFMNENGSPHYNIDGIADVTSLSLSQRRFSLLSDYNKFKQHKQTQSLSSSHR